MWRAILNFQSCSQESRDSEIIVNIQVNGELKGDDALLGGAYVEARYARMGKVPGNEMSLDLYLF